MLLLGGARKTHLGIPNLQRLAADAVQDGEETGLEVALEHGWAGRVCGGAGSEPSKQERSEAAKVMI